MEGLAVDMHGAGAAVAGVTSLLDAEHLEIAQKGAQALAGRGLFRVATAVDAIIGQANSLRISSARYCVTWRL